MQNFRALRQHLNPLMDAVLSAVGILCLHLAGHALPVEKVRRAEEILRLFLEALDDLPQTT